MSSVVGSRWVRQGGGMPTSSLTEPGGRDLSFRDREDIALPHAQGFSILQIAQSLGRSPSTISRELQRNIATTGSSAGVPGLGSTVEG